MILMYHKVSPEAPSLWWVTVDSFYRQLHALKGRKVVYLDDYDAGNPDHVVLTFDGVYRNVLEFAAPLLHQFGYPFELFITSDYFGRDNAFDAPEPAALFASMPELRTLIGMGGRLQWHTRSHRNLMDVRDESLITREVSVPDNIRVLDPSGFGWFAYPHGEYNDEVLKVVRRHFRGAVSCIQGNDTDRYLLNRTTATDALRLDKARTSVVIASYNYGAFLVEAIESVLRQTIPPAEILISDDASGDETWEIAQDYQQRHPAIIKINRNATNLGIIAHFNKAVALTGEEYVCILGADNRLRSDYLERTTACLDAAQDVAVAYTDFALFGPRAEIIADTFRQQWPVRQKSDSFHVVCFPDFDEHALERLSQINFIHGSSLFRRSAFEAVGGYLAEKPLPEDHALFLRMIKAGWRASHVALPLLEYRQHSREQANIHATSEALLHHYRRNYQQAQRQIDELHDYIEHMRGSLAWKWATPIRVAENLVRKWRNRQP